MQAATIESERFRLVAAPSQDAIAASTPAPSKSRRSLRTAAAWSVLGFIAGAMFWHIVGFWSFVSDIVLDPAPSAGATTSHTGAPTVMPPGPAQISLPTIFLVDPANCTALALERTTNRTVVQSCPAEGLALRLEPPGGREDLAIVNVQAIQPAGDRGNGTAIP